VTNIAANLRKAAVFVRSLDADTATAMLAQLSSDETAAIRQAIRRLGPLDSDEQADVLAELRLGCSAKTGATTGGVELQLSADASGSELPDAVWNTLPAASGKRFEFLEDAPVGALVTCLAREHAQTIAVVLSHLQPARAAEVLALLPEILQADTIERLTELGESDPESVTALEKELADWVAKRATSRRAGTTRTDKVGEILAAADGTTRDGILRNLKSRNAALADRIAPNGERSPRQKHTARTERRQNHRVETAQHRVSSPQHLAPSTPPVPPIDFDHLIHLDSQTLAMVLRDVDSNVLALALAGSRDDLIDRICEQMPKRIARDFRRELRRLGPTRLSDVETAQCAVAKSAAQHLAGRRRSLVAAHT
jgi:flagellar motor switch protein FliG